jgi:hypothetical protein
MAEYKHPWLTGEARAEAIHSAARCRATRAHRMDPVPAPAGSPRPQFGSLITYRCELCGTLRFDVVQRRNGELLYRTYDYPSWYTQANEDKETPAWWRATWWSDLPDELFLDAAEVTPIKRRRRA